MKATPVLVHGPDDEPVGVVVVPGGIIDKLVTGQKQRVPFDQVRTTGGDVADEAYVGFHGPRSGWLELEAVVNVRRGRALWMFRTNATGATYVRRALQRQDADLFRFWVAATEASPATVASHLCGCRTADDYRQALAVLRRAWDRGNIRQRGAA